METTASKNGTAKKPAVKKSTASAKKPAAKGTVVNIANESLKKMVSFQQTVDRLNEMQKLVDDYTKVSDTLKRLNQFKGVSGESVQFSLEDFTHENTFTTYNTNLITVVLEILIDKLEKKQTELVDNILNFQI